MRSRPEVRFDAVKTTARGAHEVCSFLGSRPADGDDVGTGIREREGNPLADARVGARYEGGTPDEGK
jgi:hypothetical protein